jgi:hypothetical protein
VHFVLVGDADGQRKPTFDKWQDSMNLHDIRDSALIHELCGGLRLNLSTYRRGTDLQLFKDMKALYPFADDDEGHKPITVANMRRDYPLPAWDTPVGTYLVIKHTKRILLNRMVNWKLAADQPKIEFLPCHGPLAGAANQPQDMIVWPGLELICYARRGFRNHPVSGVVYVVEGWKGGYLHIRQHDDYDGQPLISLPAAGNEAEAEPEVDDEAELDVDDGAESDPDVVEDLPERQEGCRLEARRRVSGQEGHLQADLQARQRAPAPAACHSLCADAGSHVPKLGGAAGPGQRLRHYA